MVEISHALVLNLHQPLGNLEHLLAHQPWEAQQILFALDRIPRSLWRHEGVGRVHLAISGTLLETLADPVFQAQVYGIVDCGSLLWHLQNRRIIEVLGGAYYHPVLPLIPPADWDEHLHRWLALARHLLWRTDFQGFWPPELGFCMAMIPALARAGYRYVIVDSEHIEPITPMRWEEIRYRPHVARYDGAEIIVVVRDRELSDAQESGMDFTWFDREVRGRTQRCDFPPLVTTCSDGDNGGWFRNVTHQANFWGGFYDHFLDAVNHQNTPIRPVFIDGYLQHYGAYGEVNVHVGAWNTGWHHGRGFTQWTGSAPQRQALARVAHVSRAWHQARQAAQTLSIADTDTEGQMEQALAHLLRAETSCNFFWGEAWVDRVHAELDAACQALEAMRAVPH